MRLSTAFGDEGTSVERWGAINAEGDVTIGWPSVCAGMIDAEAWDGTPDNAVERAGWLNERTALVPGLG